MTVPEKNDPPPNLAPPPELSWVERWAAKRRRRQLRKLGRSAYRLDAIAVERSSYRKGIVHLRDLADVLTRRGLNLSRALRGELLVHLQRALQQLAAAERICSEDNYRETQRTFSGKKP